MSHKRVLSPFSSLSGIILKRICWRYGPVSYELGANGVHPVAFPDAIDKPLVSQQLTTNLPPFSRGLTCVKPVRVRMEERMVAAARCVRMNPRPGGWVSRRGNAAGVLILRANAQSVCYWGAAANYTSLVLSESNGRELQTSSSSC